MMEALHPWIGIAAGTALFLGGVRMVSHPDAHIGVGIIPAREPRTVRIFGIASIVIGALNAALSFYSLVFVSE